MKGKFVLLILIFAFTGCAKQKDQTITEVPAVADSTATPKSTTDDECFNRKMEQWFISFNQLQAEGASMAEADKKALVEAEAEYKKCKDGVEKLTSKAKE
jgi:hypothetical protein